MSVMDINKVRILERGEMKFQCSNQYEAWFLLLSSSLARRYGWKNVIIDVIELLNTKITVAIKRKNLQIAK